MSPSRVLLLVGSLLPLTALGGCVGATGATLLTTEAGLILGTGLHAKPPPDLADQIPQHESWCYRTLADVQCFAQIQDVPPERLLNVDPQSRYPLTVAQYQATAAAPGPVVALLGPPEQPSFFDATLHIGNPPPLPPTPILPVIPAPPAALAVPPRPDPALIPQPVAAITVPTPTAPVTEMTPGPVALVQTNDLPLIP